MNSIDRQEISLDTQPLKANFLQQISHNLDLEKLEEYLSIPENQINQLRQGGFGSIIFDTIFDRSIIPQRQEPFYEQAFNQYFLFLYGSQIGASGQLVTKEKIFRLEEQKFHYEGQDGPNSPQFLQDWVANFRVIYLMLNHFRPDPDNLQNIKNAFTEISLWKIFDLEETVPRKLLKLLPLQERKKLQEEMELMRRMIGKIQMRDNQLLKIIVQSKQAICQEAMLKTPAFFKGLPPHWKLPEVLNRKEHLEYWVNLILGLDKGELPDLNTNSN